MRKIILGVVAAAAIATPLAALAGPANAATTSTGSMDFVTNATYVHHAAVAYTCDVGGKVTFTFQGDDEGFTGHGNGTIVGSGFTVSGSRLTDGYTYSIAGTLDSAKVWTVTGVSDSI